MAKQKGKIDFPQWLRYKKGTQERAKVLFLDIRGMQLDLDDRVIRQKINAYLGAMLEAVGISDKTSGPALIKCHIGEPKCNTRMIPDFALPSINYLRKKGVEKIACGDSTVVYKSDRGYRQNPRGNLKRYEDLISKSGWNSRNLGIPFVILDRPETSIPGKFEFRDEQVEKKLSSGDTFKKVYASAGWERAHIIINHVHLTLHGLAHLALAIKGIAMGGASRAGKLQMHQYLFPEIDAANCLRCGKCAQNCPEGALDWQKSQSPTLIAKRCLGCGQCKSICDGIANAVTMKGKEITDWSKGSSTFAPRLVEYVLRLMMGKWNNLINIAHLYRITSKCDCVNEPQTPIVSDIGFVVGKNPFAIDYYARSLFNRQAIKESKGTEKKIFLKRKKIPNMIAKFYPDDHSQSYFDYARKKFGLVVEPEVTRIRFR